jgi:hypothetical protein
MAKPAPSSMPAQPTSSPPSPGPNGYEHTSQSDDGNPSYVIWRWTAIPAPGGATVTVEWTGYPKTFWRQFLFAKQRRRQLRDEVPASLRALAYHLVSGPNKARPSYGSSGFTMKVSPR